MELSKLKRNTLNLAICMITVVFCVTTLVPAACAVDFNGKRIEWIVPFKEGGGSSQWAHFLSPLLSEQLPGKPVIAVKNVPGGGSTKGANQFALRAKPDGLTILGTSGSTQFPYLLGDKRVQYEYKDWHLIMATPTGGVFYVSPSLGIKSAAELAKLKGKDLKYASQGATSLDLVPLLAFELLGLDVKAVFGMKGRGSGRLAFERGEVNLDYQTSAAYLKRSVPLVESGKAIPILAWGALDDDGKIVRDPTFPDLPSFPEVYEMVHGKKPSGEAWNAWKAFFTAGFPVQKMVFLPKGTPQEIVDAYRAAAKKMITAPGFAAKAEKILGSYPQAVGKPAEIMKNQAITVDDAAKNWIRNWLTTKYSVKF